MSSTALWHCDLLATLCNTNLLKCGNCLEPYETISSEPNPPASLQAFIECTWMPSYFREDPTLQEKNQCTSNSDAYRFMLSACARKMQTQSYKLLSPKCPQGYECDLRLHSPLQILLATMVSVREVALRTAASCSHCVFLFYVKDHKVQIGPRTHSVQLICTR